MGQGVYIDPIAHAWRYCNPHAPLPPALVRYTAPPGFALRRFPYISQLVPEWSGTKDTQSALLAVAALPRISSPVASEVTSHGNLTG